MSATPSSAPAEATKTTTPPVETVFDDVKNNTQRELQKLKDKLEVKDTDSTHSKEWEKIKEKFTAEKETITKISEVELVQLKKDIHDSNEELTGELKVEAGSLVYHEVVADGTSATPETPTTEPSNQETPVNLGDITTQVPESYQKEVKNYIVDNGGFAGMVMKGISNWVTEIIKGIKGFFATFGIEDEGEKKDALAQINGFEDAEEERRVTSSVKALKSSPVTKGPPLSDLLKISHISNEELTKILKDNPGLDFSSTKNIEAAFTGKYKHSGDSEPMRRYDRIFINLKDIHSTIDPAEPYNATNKFKEILSGSNKTELDNRIPESENTIPGPITAPTGIEEDSTSPEGQTQDLIDARKLDTDLQKSRDELVAAKAISPATDESKKKVIETETALKSSQEKMENLKKYEKGIMITALEDTNKELETLKAQKTVLESKEPKDTKEKTDNKTQIDFYEKNKAGITEKIKSVMTTSDSNTEKWNFQDTKTASDIVTARIGIQSIMEQTPISATEAASENQEPETEKLSQEITILSQEIEKSAQTYSEATTPEGKAALKKTAEDKLKSLQEKNTAAIGINKTIQENYTKQPDKARRSEEAMKQILVSLENAQKAIKNIETEGASELPPLEPTDPKNVLYKNGKLYQRDADTPGNFREMIYQDGVLKLSESGFFDSGTSNLELINQPAKKIADAGYKILPYSEANTILRGLSDAQRKQNKEGWIYITPDYFAGKLRNIKID